MKAARLHRYGRLDDHGPALVLEEVPDPRVQAPDDVVLRVAGAGVCRTDLHILEGMFQGIMRAHLPYIPGHENAGWVEEVGPAVRSVRKGDPVLVYPMVSDGVCLACRQGQEMHCEVGAFVGLDRDGGFAEYLLVKERNCIRLPEGLPPEEAAPFADAGLAAYHAVKRAVPLLGPGGLAVLLGFGGLGHLAYQMLRALCPARIAVVDRSEEARSWARELGADAVFPADPQTTPRLVEWSQGRGAQVVLDFVGEGGAPALGWSLLGRRGTYFVVGYGDPLTVPTMELVAMEKAIVGNLVGTYAELVELVHLAAEGKVRAKTVRYPLQEANQALTDLHHGRVRGRAVLVP
ncbi:MAG: NAD(P)-dependent alcohol dehydrogenase [Armatimonadota bacterium]|nr:NAD(P)-dependent alcohol dehydrogenase [Armatimonadota bacterium]MDR7439522.1 NAD(P)-dependent alcohol dehydrogenase [Armatimonadota bacterium]MDR7563440.1 NAD(P)-dependent alcohol dehydrogenase [Armatimonadota bacterium]MDR7567464.1 NAD(P)-dependent alcohol dehydrogenase [Armatimonadota bacterium]MDR7601278.1 NAD(P)-dependent alcohol dehydrogenase [Armatimonadota bacterium]